MILLAFSQKLHTKKNNRRGTVRKASNNMPLRSRRSTDDFLVVQPPSGAYVLHTTYYALRCRLVLYVVLVHTCT